MCVLLSCQVFKWIFWLRKYGLKLRCACLPGYVCAAVAVVGWTVLNFHRRPRCHRRATERLGGVKRGTRGGRPTSPNITRERRAESIQARHSNQRLARSPTRRILTLDVALHESRDCCCCKPGLYNMRLIIYYTIPTDECDRHFGS
jgi:hypothetical protein